MNKNEKYALDALGGVDPALIEEAAAEKYRKRRPMLGKIAVIAACLCVAVVGVAVAAEVVGFDFVQTYLRVDENPSGEKETMAVLDMEAQGPAIPRSELSQEGQAWLAEADGGKYIEKGFATLDEVEEFLGVELLDHEYLSAAVPRPVIVEGSDEMVDGNVVLTANTDFELSEPLNTTALMIKGNYYWTARNASVSLRATFSVGDEATGGMGYSWPKEDAEWTREDYVTPNGLETVMVKADSTDDGVCSTYVGMFVHNGACFNIRVSVSGTDRDDGMEVLRDLLDEVK